ncbi:5'-nucleotidase, lipoprotein e(P4) family [Olivibacter domesticus]|uniref:5'-nucleotidase, lipoprotein e(P4) family n=1 Tax=Olivibacter domesticus TaxID=407022 RepID=A0A1H7XA50_OLID1|nr:5'-nucleotidase, lipoprotein e(P4) family [Olivibacter domesticus]SEM30690.1 5'-nucleotidase, lipoprotein e(P4) family [Olivibacter domesticus]
MRVFSFLLVFFILTFASGQEHARDNTNAVLWQQRSGEYRALCFQAYNYARVSLDKQMKRRTKKPKCIIVDIDETVLDNSPQSGKLLLMGKSFDLAEWKQWTALEGADTVPGACSFLKYAASKKVEVFYVSNRDQSELIPTMNNLNRFGFPYVDTTHMLFRDDTSNKQHRRDLIAETHHIIMLVGDNLSDFSTVFYQDDKDVKIEVDKLATLFGTVYIMLPNPMYGDWEQSLYEKKKNLTENEKAEIRKEKIIAY